MRARLAKYQSASMLEAIQQTVDQQMQKKKSLYYNPQKCLECMTAPEILTQ